MTTPVCTCPETDPIERATRYTVRSLGDEPHAANCPRRGIRSAGWPAAPEPRYTVEHQDWCHAETHKRCCNLNSVDVEDCDCGAAEAQAEIDALADTVRVQRQALDSIESYVQDCAANIGRATVNGRLVRAMATFITGTIRGAR